MCGEIRRGGCEKRAILIFPEKFIRDDVLYMGEVKTYGKWKR